ncbi:c-type cytochrome [bacterium]|nr:c-type cytochrome [bacterium]
MSEINLPQLDRRIKWALLLTSLATLAVLLASALAENVFAPWRIIRGRYAGILAEKAGDARGAALARQFENRIVQNVLPELGTVDRCITCHPGVDDPRMTDQPQPYRAHSGDYLIHHPPEKFGCTVCHRGQGRALTFEEAKAVGHHWDYPLLPPEYTQSSCGLCHTGPEVEHRGGEVYALGERLFGEKGCRACHRLSGRGGSLGPALDGVGMKVRGQLPMAGVSGEHTLPQWLAEHFDSPQRVVPGSLMKPPQLSREENTALTVYMLSLQNRDLPRSYLSPEKHREYYLAARPAPASGEALFSQFCSPCHDTGEIGIYDKFYAAFAPAVRGVAFAQIASASYVEAVIREGRPGTAMPAWGAAAGGLSDAEIAELRRYLLATPVPQGSRLAEPILARAHDPNYRSTGDAGRGAAIFTRHCTGCHGPGGAGLLAPSLVTSTFQRHAADGFLYATIAEGRANTAMPGFLSRGGFFERDIEDVIAYLRKLGGQDRAASPVARAQGQP